MNTESPTTKKRNLSLFIGILVLVGVLLVVMKLLTTDDQGSIDDEQAQNTNTEAISNTNTQAEPDTPNATDTPDTIDQRDSVGFWIAAFEKELPQPIVAENGDTTYIFEDESAVAVLDATQESIIKGSLGSVTETALVLDGHTATYLTGTSPKDGTTLSYIIVDAGEDILYFRGEEAFLTEVQESLRFTDEEGE